MRPLHRIPLSCKKTRLLVNKNLGLGRTESGARRRADIGTIKSSHFFLLFVLLQKFATVNLLRGPARYGESWCFFGKSCVESCVPPAGCLMKGTLIPAPNAA